MGTFPPDVAPVEAFQAGADQLVLAPQMDVASTSQREQTVTVLETGTTPSQALVTALLATGKPVVVSGMRYPYDISHLTEAPTYLVTYGFTATGALYPFGHGPSYRG